MTGLVKPTVGGDYDTWGPKLNDALDYLDQNKADVGSVLAFPSAFSSKTSTFTASSSTTLYECDTTSGGFTANLPSNPAVGFPVFIKKVSGDTNTLTIAAAGGGTIDGSATATTVTQWAGLVIEHRGSNVWRVVASMSTSGRAGTNGTNGTNGAISSVQDEGSAMTVRSKLNFVGSAVTLSDDAANDRTTVTVAGGSSAALWHTRSGEYLAAPEALGLAGVEWLGNANLGYVFAVPFPVPEDFVASGLGVYVSTAAGAGGVVRLGIYSDSNGRPGSLVVDGGSQPATTVGPLEVAISQALSPGLVWLAAVTQVSGAKLYASRHVVPLPSTLATLAGAQMMGWADNGSVTGGLPATFTPTYRQLQNSGQTAVPRILVKRS